MLEGHHNIIVIVGAGTMSILVMLVLAYQGIKKKELEADKKIRERQESWN